jgi:hypothetical protein
MIENFVMNVFFTLVYIASVIVMYFDLFFWRP